MSYIDDVQQFITDRFLFGDGSKLTKETPFLEGGIIDSTGILELVTFIEEKYKIKINDDELLPENLDSLKNVGSFLQKKITR